MHVGTAGPTGVRAAAQFVGQLNATHRAGFKLFRIDQDDFRALGVLVGDEADQIAVVLILSIDPRDEGRLAGKAAFGKIDGPGFARHEVMLDEAIELD